jgi:hypothetical protein
LWAGEVEETSTARAKSSNIGLFRRILMRLFPHSGFGSISCRSHNAIKVGVMRMLKLETHPDHVLFLRLSYYAAKI